MTTMKNDPEMLLAALDAVAVSMRHSTDPLMVMRGATVQYVANQLSSLLAQPATSPEGAAQNQPQ